MQNAEVIRRCGEIVTGAGLDDVAVNATNFLDYSNLVRDIIQDWSSERRNSTRWLKPFAQALRKMRDDFEAQVQADPLQLYKPMHHVAMEFHSSLALVRYLRAPNRTSKTQASVQDNYWVVTGQHPWRPRAPLPSSVAVIGTSFTKYCPQVFEAKYLYGEAGNPLSPAFPDGGKWFNHYDPRKHIISLACPDCAERGKAKQCKHPHSKLILFSDNEGPIVLAGGQYAQVHIDEQIAAAFFPESLKRIETVPNSGIVVSETPLGGKAFWTHQILTRDFKAKKKVGDSDQPLVSLHTIDQFSAGLTSPDRIRASMELMTKAEAEARVFGRPAAFAEHGIFDGIELEKMQDEATEPRRGGLIFKAELDGDDTVDVLTRIVPGTRPQFYSDDAGELRLWQKPEPLSQYLIGVDVAQGLINGDASCAQVMRVRLVGTTLLFDQVASLHGWINPRVYAQDVMRLAIWYNDALVVPERNGPGHEFIRSLKEFGYWNIFRDVTDPAQSEFQADPILGITTTGVNKGSMISILQQCVKDKKTKKRTIVIRDVDTLDEMSTYAQEKSERGHITFNGVNGSHDDRVMALVVVVYAAVAFGLFDLSLHVERQAEEQKSELTEDQRRTWESFHQEQAELEAISESIISGDQAWME